MRAARGLSVVEGLPADCETREPGLEPGDADSIWTAAPQIAPPAPLSSLGQRSEEIGAAQSNNDSVAPKPDAAGVVGSETGSVLGVASMPLAGTPHPDESDGDTIFNSDAVGHKEGQVFESNEVADLFTTPKSLVRPFSGSCCPRMLVNRRYGWGRSVVTFFIKYTVLIGER